MCVFRCLSVYLYRLLAHGTMEQTFYGRLLPHTHGMDLWTTGDYMCMYVRERESTVCVCVCVCV